MGEKLRHLGCPTCGAPLSARFREVGTEKCRYCDVVSVYDHDRVVLESGKEPTPAARSVGKVRRYGTVVLAPVLGWSACAILNLQRQFRYAEEIVEVSLFLGACIITLMLLGRWLVAGIWTLFFTLSLITERSLAFHEVGPMAYFSFTSEVSLMPTLIAAGALTAFGVFFATAGQLAHEQQKIAWRTPVAVMFLVGLVVGLGHHSRPYSEEVYRAWAWSYAEEMQRITVLEPKLKAGSPATDSIPEGVPAARWTTREPSESNVVFLAKDAIPLFPEMQLFQLKSDQTLWLTGFYSYNLGYAAKTIDDRAYFSPTSAHQAWRSRIDDPLQAPWLVIYQNEAAARHTRFWLIHRPVAGVESHSRRTITFEIVGYREMPWPDVGGDDKWARERQWIVDTVLAMTSS